MRIGFPSGSRSIRLARRLIGFGRQREATILELLLDVPDVVKVRQRLARTVPAWIEGHDVLVEHPLEKANRGRFVLEDQPVFGLVAAKHPEAELLVERT